MHAPGGTVDLPAELRSSFPPQRGKFFEESCPLAYRASECPHPSPPPAPARRALGQQRCPLGTPCAEPCLPSRCSSPLLPSRNGRLRRRRRARPASGKK